MKVFSVRAQLQQTLMYPTNIFWKVMGFTCHTAISSIKLCGCFVIIQLAKLFFFFEPVHSSDRNSRHCNGSGSIYNLAHDDAKQKTWPSLNRGAVIQVVALLSCDFRPQLFCLCGMRWFSTLHVHRTECSKWFGLVIAPLLATRKVLMTSHTGRIGAIAFLNPYYHSAL